MESAAPAQPTVFSDKIRKIFPVKVYYFIIPWTFSKRKHTGRPASVQNHPAGFPGYLSYK